MIRSSAYAQGWKAVYPLMFKFPCRVVGRGYLASVEAKGRCLLVREEDDEWWFYGVQPGGVAAHGTTPREAQLDFWRVLGTALDDFARESSGYEMFRQHAHALLLQINRPNEAFWEGARAKVRAGAVVDEAFVRSLIKWTGDQPPRALIRRLSLSATRSGSPHKHEELARAA